jgi:RsiW-degrading membrane proteinase PrsW (M82 family)
VFAILRWLVIALAPVLFLWVVYHSDRDREPRRIVGMTFGLGVVAGFGAFAAERSLATWIHLDAYVSAMGAPGSLLFAVLAALIGEAFKVLATWPVFKSRYFDEPYDGIVYASTAALGFAAVMNAMMLRTHPSGGIWIARAVLALPAHVFFASLWGYGLGRAKQNKRTGRAFPSLWVTAWLFHALYAHLVRGRPEGGALVGILPFLFVMAVIAAWARRDLLARGDRPSRLFGDNRLSRISFAYVSAPPSLRTVREALRRADQPIMLRWILIGTLVTMGTMITGFAVAIAISTQVFDIDFSQIDERSPRSMLRVAPLIFGVLAAFPLSGFLIARASNLPSLAEPLLATVIALILALLLLGVAVPAALVFAIPFSFVAGLLAFVGTWIGRPAA